MRPEDQKRHRRGTCTGRDHISSCHPHGRAGHRSGLTGAHSTRAKQNPDRISAEDRDRLTHRLVKGNGLRQNEVHRRSGPGPGAR